MAGASELLALPANLYAAREYDSETGLYYNRARYYDPTAGRFLSEDPLGYAAGDTNLYRYAFNSPTHFTDPSGEFIFLAPLVTWAAGLTAGAAATYFATQAGLSAVETGVEAGISYYMGGEAWEEFSVGGTFAKNFVVNSATGGIGSKGKWLAKAGAWAGRQGIEIAGDTAYDVYVGGRDFGSSLVSNTVGSLLGEAGGKLAGYGLRQGYRGAKALSRNFQITVDRSGVYFGSLSGGLRGLGGLRVSRRLAVNEAIETGALSVRRARRASQIHHIASPEDSVFGPKFQKLFKNAGESLRNSPFNRTRLASHVGPHGKFANRVVFRRLTEAIGSNTPGSAGYRAALLDELWKLRRDIQNTDFGDIYRAAASRADVLGDF